MTTFWPSRVRLGVVPPAPCRFSSALVDLVESLLVNRARLPASPRRVRISGQAQVAVRRPAAAFLAAWARLSASCSAIIWGMRAAAASQASCQGFSRIGL